MKHHPLRIGILAAAATCAALTMFGCPPSNVPTSDIEIALLPVAGGLTAPTDMVLTADGSERIFVCEQTGRVRTLDRDGNVVGTLLDLTSKLATLSSGYDERGLLGIALHPDFAANGRLFVYYIAPPGADLENAIAGESRISEFILPSGADSIDPATERIVLRFGQPQGTHNGGQMKFGSDGYLYIATGDGGNRGDSGTGHGPDGNGQNLGTLLGKILRIDIEPDDAYAIPADNPFVNVAGARPEIFAYGLRNPWRFSFDPTSDTPRLLVGDVGQSLREEISAVTSGDNCGWRIREGDVCFDVNNLLVPLADCAAVDARGATLVDPLISYDHAAGTSVIGGLVCTASGVAGLDGQYLFGDFTRTTGGADGRLYVADIFGSSPGTFREVRIGNRAGDRLGMYLYAFTAGPDGTVYVLANGVPGPTGTSGAIFRVAASSE